MPAQLTLELRGEAARIVRSEAGVLVELQHRRGPAGQTARRRVLAQGLVHHVRRAAGRQQQPGGRPREQPIADQLGRHQPDAARIGEHQRRRAAVGGRPAGFFR